MSIENWDKQMSAYNEAVGGSGSADEWLKLSEPSHTYKLRVLTQPVTYAEVWGKGICYDGAEYCQKEYWEGQDGQKPSIRNLSWVYDYEDSKVKLFKMPYTIAKELLSLAKDDEYGFDKFPMPYDIKITTNEKAGTKEVEYKTIASRQNTPVPEGADISEKTSCEEIVERMKEKKMQEDGQSKDLDQKLRDDYPTEEIAPEDIPF